MLAAAVTVTIMLISVFSAVIFNSVSKPFLQDASGNKLTSAKVGQIVMASTFLTNNQDKSQSYIVILEARDQDDLTVFLQLSSVNLSASSATYVAAPWSPDEVGNFSLRTFAISNFTNVEILTLVTESDVTITY